MLKEESCLIGPLPPPYSGHSISFAMLCAGFHERRLPHRIINFSSGRVRKDGEISLQRLGSLVLPLCSGLRLLLAPRCNVYLTNSQSWLGFLKDLVFILCAVLGGHRIVLHLKGGNYDNFYREQSRLRRWIIRRTLAAADRLIVLGEALRQVYAFVPGHEDKVVVVNNGLSEDLPDWNEVRGAKNHGDEEEIRILYLSAMIESKGYLDLLEATNRLVHMHNLNVKADFCGDFRIISDSRLYKSVEEARVDFLRRVATNRLQEHVVWHGTVSGSQKRDMLARADYFILPTNYKYEGQPVSIIEAMAYGALVISTPYRTIPEMLAGGQAGILVGPNQPAQIVEAVLRHKVGSARYRALVEAARARCAALFGRKRHLDRLIGVITGDRSE